MVDVWPQDLAEGSRVVLVLQNPAGVLPAVVEQVVDPREALKTEAGAGKTVPRPRAQPPTTRKTDAAPPVRALGGTPTAGSDASPVAEPAEEPAEPAEPAEEPAEEPKKPAEPAEPAEEPKKPAAKPKKPAAKPEP